MCQSAVSRETESIGLITLLIAGIGSWHYGSWGHDLLSATCRPRKDAGVIQSKSEGLRTGSTNVQGWEKMGIPAQAERSLTFPAFLLYSGPQWIGWRLFRPSVDWMASIQDLSGLDGVYSGPQWIGWRLFRPSVDWMAPPASGRAIFSTQSTNSNAHLFQRHLHRHTQKLFYQLSGHRSAQSS